MAKVKNFAVDVGNLHEGDSVFLVNRKMNVLAINPDSRRVLIIGRKQKCGNCDIRWIAEHRLGTRPRNISKKKIKNLFSLSVDTMDGISDWVPIKIPKPTDAPPGSPAKIEEMRNRVSRGEQLWHPEDVDYSGWIAMLGGEER